MYVDGFVLPVKKTKLKEYKKVASKAGKIWMKHGALQYLECVGEELKPNTQGQKINTFPKLLKTKPGETVLYSFIVYRSKKHRDSVNKKVMKDPSMTEDCKEMPFDVKRMTWGGFETIVKLQKK